MQIISRKDALKQGLTRYFTGKACSKGHVSERYVKCYNCVECSLINKLKYKKNKKISRESNKFDWKGVSYKQAVVKNLRFYEGKPCVKCGQTKRYTNNSSCVACEYIKSKSLHRKQYIRFYNSLYINKVRNRERYIKYKSSHSVVYIKGKKSNYYNDYASYDTYAGRLTILEEPRNNNGILEVKCAKCRKYFKPKQMHVNKRIYCLSGNYKGENRLYCSVGCKETWAVYNKKADVGRPLQSQWVKQLRNDRLQLYGELRCDKCGVKEDHLNYSLIGHHIDPVINNPIESADIDNGMLICKRCHKEVHTIPGCTMVELKC